MVIKKVFVAFLLFLNFALSPAVSEISLTLEKAVQFAKENNLSIKKSEKSLDSSRIKNKYSWNSVSPTISANASAKDDFEKDTTSLSVSGSLSLKLTPNLYTSIKSAKLDYENGILSYEQAVRSVELSVRKTFYNLLYEQENIALQKRGLETSKITYNQNQEKFKNGKISELDVLTSRVNYEQKVPVVQQAEITFESDLASFKQVLGLDANDEILLEGTLDDALLIKEVSFESLPKPEKAAPNIQTAQKNVEIANNSLLSTRFSKWGPSITGSYGYGKSYAKSQLSGDYEWSTSNELSVGISIPLDGYLPWSSGAVEINSAKNNVESAKIALEDAERTVAVQTETYIRKINLAISQLESLKATENLAKETYSMTQAAYNYGKADLLTLQNANDSVLSAGVSLKSQAFTLISAVLDLENLLGIEFGTLGK